MRITKITVALLSAAIAIPFVGLVPAQADVTWSGCDTDTFVKKVKKKGKVKLKVKQTATGCMEQHTWPDGSFCGVVTSYDLDVAARATTRRKASTVSSWSASTSPLPVRSTGACGFFDAQYHNSQVAQKFAGAFALATKKGTRYAAPSLTITVSAATPDLESIVTIAKSGTWKFASVRPPRTRSDPRSRHDPRMRIPGRK